MTFLGTKPPVLLPSASCGPNKKFLTLSDSNAKPAPKPKTKLPIIPPGRNKLPNNPNPPRGPAMLVSANPPPITRPRAIPLGIAALNCFSYSFLAVSVS